MIQITRRFFLCPACDGYGAFGNGEHPNSPDYDDSDCLDCDGKGTQRLPIVEGDAKGLQPWGGPRGRNAARNPIKHTDPLVRLADRRTCPRNSAAFAYDYPLARRRAMKPVALPGGQR